MAHVGVMAAGRSVAPCHGSIVGIEDISFLALPIRKLEISHTNTSESTRLFNSEFMILSDQKKGGLEAQIAIDCISDGRGDGGDFGKVPPAGQVVVFSHFFGGVKNRSWNSIFCPKNHSL